VYTTHSSFKRKLASGHSQKALNLSAFSGYDYQYRGHWAINQIIAKTKERKKRYG